MASYAIPTPVHISIPEDPEQLTLLHEALWRMGLQYLLRIPWNVQLESYVKDFHNDAPVRRRFRDTVRGESDRWDWDFIGRAFQCPSEGQKGFSQRHPLCVPYFSGPIDPSHGWKLSTVMMKLLGISCGFSTPFSVLGSQVIVRPVWRIQF